jgi:hypothetical protein
MINFVDDLLPYSRNSLLPTIPRACTSLYNFYQSLAGCGIPGLDETTLRQYVCDPVRYGARYALCECGGGGVGRLGKNIIAAFLDLSVRNEIANYISAYFAGLGTVTLDYSRIYNCDDRVVHDFSGTFNGTAIQNAWAEYLGIPKRRVIVGVGIHDTAVAGKCVATVSWEISSLKRYENVAQATVQILNGASSFVLSQLVVLLCALVYFM